MAYPIFANVIFLESLGLVETFGIVKIMFWQIQIGSNFKFVCLSKFDLTWVLKTIFGQIQLL